ncbi:LEAF RUST 10 DISEASE-RESISTANCE LOCUS RECEPTOR-LIKE PROTEIN KINASE-like 2.4 [Macadamia integrifolia]|uniref:LEAF RUST 10 DISEASE-RESISTANCE LOCUS RECEPTOR-LIKE PROTEIN KINASE-like 2.4 n=1 Tax=Macadamia integrifolia TaxID=60698 RepID=UPI001C4F20E5|nr:LEAF RUST 10 DISEASE-RESISTANCE LOCUS RECEPTOR-LIKE PROTEIN KINASE-like 2.4 [Macadamia integrifolia]
MCCSICLRFSAFLVSVFLFFLLLHLPLLSAGPDHVSYCSALPHFCGNLNISYPFFFDDTKFHCNSRRGVELIRCINGSTSVLIYTGVENDDSTYEVQSINYTTNTILARDRKSTRDWLSDNDKCNALFNNYTMPPIFRYLSAHVISPNLTLRVCKRHPINGVVLDKDCTVEAIPDAADVPAPGPSSHSSTYDCKLVHLPVDVRPSTFHGLVDPVSKLFTAGFRVQWNLPKICHQCEKNGTVCSRFHDQQDNLSCVPKDGEWNHGNGENHRTFKMNTTRVIVFSFILAITLVAILVGLVYYVYHLTRKLSSNGPMSFTQNVEAFLRNYGSLAPKRYSYSDIKKITNSFKEKLGQGGYGGVFKGKLPDGRLVAVKVLNASKGNGEEFINEVASISSTSHVNIVTLLGFCFDGSKRALIYEFMSNGSLEKFIYNKKSMKTCPHFGWERLYQIAVGTAQGLEYLHRGCNTRILHFDIKPHNILLDEDFCPKISDFGLAKLCPRKGSIISMADARGTVGYIAPEVFSRNFGGVSHKSDVYSYGMMVLEMVGGRKNIDAEVDYISEIYFPHWIYKHIGQDKHLPLDMIMGEEEEGIAKKMVLVGLWCIQMNPTNRPSISKVVNMLEGTLESLPIPPKPVFSSPPRHLADSFTRSTS